MTPQHPQPSEATAATRPNVATVPYPVLVSLVQQHNALLRHRKASLGKQTAERVPRVASQALVASLHGLRHQCMAHALSCAECSLQRLTGLGVACARRYTGLDDSVDEGSQEADRSGFRVLRTSWRGPHVPQQLVQVVQVLVSRNTRTYTHTRTLGHRKPHHTHGTTSPDAQCSPVRWPCSEWGPPSRLAGRCVSSLAPYRVGRVSSQQLYGPPHPTPDRPLHTPGSCARPWHQHHSPPPCQR